MPHSDVDAMMTTLIASFSGGTMSVFAQAHLFNGACPWEHIAPKQGRHAANPVRALASIPRYRRAMQGPRHAKPLPKFSWGHN
jgi:hypothetical protein